MGKTENWVGGCLLAAGAIVCMGAFAAHAAQPDPKDLAYVSDGTFGGDKKFSAERFVRVLSVYEELEKKTRKKVKEGLERAVAQKAKSVLGYFQDFPKDVCVQRQVVRKLFSPTFAEFYQGTVGVRERVADICKDLEKKLYAPAREVLDKMLIENPMDADAYLHRAVVLLRMGDDIGAGADYRNALKSPKDDPVPLGELKDAVDALYDKVMGLPAVDCLCSASLLPDVLKLQEKFRVSEEAKKEGTQHFVAGKYEPAVARFGAAIASDPSDPESYVSRAIAGERTGKDLDRVVADYGRASKIAAKAGRWDMAADALVGWTRVGGVDRKKVLSEAIQDLEELLLVSSPEWERRKKMAEELESLKAEAKKLMPATP